MELALSLGDAPTKKPPCMARKQAGKTGMGLGLGLGLGICTALGVSLGGREELEETEGIQKRRSADSPLQPDLPFVNLVGTMGGFDTNRSPLAERVSSWASDDDEEEIGLARKKIRLSKEQSAFLEKDFKEHTTLNPTQKVALAKELNLPPRQVQVWFQNRRARTKLKQTEMDFENLKRCCETLAEENRRLQWDLAHLLALKATHPLYTKLPASTLPICPSCKCVTS